MVKFYFCKSNLCAWKKGGIQAWLVLLDFEGQFYMALLFTERMCSVFSTYTKPSMCNNRRRCFRLASHCPGVVLHSAHCSIFGFWNHIERLSIQCQHMKLPHISFLVCARHHLPWFYLSSGSAKTSFFPGGLVCFSLHLILQGKCASVSDNCGMA